LRKKKRAKSNMKDQCGAKGRGICICKNKMHMDGKCQEYKTSDQGAWSQDSHENISP